MTTATAGRVPRSAAQALTVVFATLNRGPVLWSTLGHICNTDRQGLTVDLVVVDNNSTDETADVIQSFRDRLTIRYLFEPRPGKNRALNRALDCGRFHPLVVFTDDDIRPARDWFQAIVAVSRRWPDHKVFGGRIEPEWPLSNPPAWVHDDHIRRLAFAAHHLGTEEQAYPATQQPFGPNFWLRREVLETGVRFDESVGPGTGTLGDEVMFLHDLQKNGFEIVYSPHARVEHRIQPEGLSEKKLVERALMVGRIGPTMYGLCRPELFRRAPWLWRCGRHVRLTQARIALLRARLDPRPDRRLIRSISPLINIGYNTESLRLARELPPRRDSGGTVLREQ